MAELNIELFNNQLVQKLVGASDSNLRLIEKMLNVEILCFGNQIALKGNPKDIEDAKNAINILYDKVSKSIEVGEQEVKAAVRICSGVHDEGEAQNLNEIVLKTKNRQCFLLIVEVFLLLCVVASVDILQNAPIVM